MCRNFWFDEFLIFDKCYCGIHLTNWFYEHILVDFNLKKTIRLGIVIDESKNRKKIWRFAFSAPYTNILYRMIYL